MKTKAIAIIGVSGFLGQATARYFREMGWKTIGFSRRPLIEPICQEQLIWNLDTPNPLADQLDGIEAVVNLAGRSVDCRYDRRHKAEILRSRLESTRALGEAIARCRQPPKVWLNAASATIYKAAYDRAQTEVNSTIGRGFSVSVCRAWENAFFSAHTPHTRKVALRTSLVLGHGQNSVYPRLALLARLGLGGPIGDGRQMVSWIHEFDFVRALAFLIDDESIEGAVNLAAPAPLPSRDFMRSLRGTIGVPFGLHVPQWLLGIGAFLLRTEPELVLKSRFVLPKRLLDERFIFRYPFVDEAFQNLANRSLSQDRCSSADTRAWA